MRSSEAITTLAAALVKVQASVEVASRDRENPHLRSKYADLTSVWNACRSALTENGFAVVQFPSYADGQARVITRLLHASGEWLESELSLPIPKQDPQGVGVGITYARRYSLSAMVGVVSEEDDDGEGAKGSKEAARAVAEKKRAALQEQADKSTPKPAGTSFDVLSHFGAIKKEIGAAAQRAGHSRDDQFNEYYRVLGRHGFEKSNQIPTTTRENVSSAREIYREMGEALKDLRSKAEPTA